jgi:hypothetical protein
VIPGHDAQHSSVHPIRTGRRDLPSPPAAAALLGLVGAVERLDVVIELCAGSGRGPAAEPDVHHVASSAATRPFPVVLRGAIPSRSATGRCLEALTATRASTARRVDVEARDALVAEAEGVPEGALGDGVAVEVPHDLVDAHLDDVQPDLLEGHGLVTGEDVGPLLEPEAAQGVLAVQPCSRAAPSGQSTSSVTAGSGRSRSWLL